MFNAETLQALFSVQRNEITEYYIYKKLANSTKDPKNRQILDRISKEELDHYYFWKEFTRADIRPNRWQIWKYFIISKILGITFGIKLMERGEKGAQLVYGSIARRIPDSQEEISALIKSEQDHEKQLVDLIDEERLRYIGSVVLGLNDALVELTGALAGFTFAFQKTRVIAMAGLVTGIAASLSMATSEYLSTRVEGIGKNPVQATLYTGLSYIITVLILVSPYFVFPHPYLCLGVTLANGILIILFFTFYLSVAKDIPFLKRFMEMVAISLGIAGASFLIGILIRRFLNISDGMA